MVTQLLKHERIETTVSRAKELRKWCDQMITYGKKNNRMAFSKAYAFIKEKEVMRKLFTELKDRYAHRPGGYCRVMRTRTRRGDAAPLAFIELVDRPGELRPAAPCQPNQQENQVLNKREREKKERVIYEAEFQAYLNQLNELNAKSETGGYIYVPPHVPSSHYSNKLHRIVNQKVKISPLNIQLPHTVYSQKVFHSDNNNNNNILSAGQSANTLRSRLKSTSSPLPPSSASSPLPPSSTDTPAPNTTSPPRTQ